jgi:hypothetical protein
MRDRFFDRELSEKVVLLSLVAIVFVQGLQFDATIVEVAVTVTLVILANTAVSEWLARRGHIWTAQRFLSHFLRVGVLNFAIFLVLAWLLEEGNLLRSGFFLVLLTLIVTMYDRYRPEYIARFSTGAERVAAENRTYAAETRT